MMSLKSLTWFLFMIGLSFSSEAFSWSSGEAEPIIPMPGLAAEGRADWQTAVSIYLDYLAKNPDRADLWIRIATIEHQLKNYPVSIDAYQHAIRLQPNKAELHKTLSEVYAEVDQPALALSEINKASRLNPKNADYLIARARIANWAQDKKVALDSYQQLLSLSQTASVPMRREDIFIEIALLEAQFNRYPEAIKAYEQALQLSPGRKEALQKKEMLERIMKMQASRGAAKALSPFDQFVATANNEALAKHYSLAAIALKHAIAMKPKDASLYKKLSELYATAKNPPLALAAITQALRLAPKNIAYWRAKAALAAWAGDRALAQQSYERILQLKPYDQQAMLNIAHSLAWQGHIDLALTSYQQLLLHHPHDAEGWIQYAEVLTWTQNYIKAFEALARYKAIKGATFNYQQTVARTFALADRYRSALSYNTPLLKQAPDNVYALLTESIALRKALKLNPALANLNKATQRSPTDPQVTGLNKITWTPLRSNINAEAFITEASDTTKIWDFPVNAQYFLDPTTSVVALGLYERTTAASWSPLRNINGSTVALDESVMFGMTKQFQQLNLKGYAGALKILGENNHGIYDANVTGNLNEKMQISVESLRNLYRPYLIPQTPKSVSSQIMESRNGFFLQMQPWLQKYLNVITSYSTLSDANHYWHVNAWPKARVFGSEKILLSLGVDADIWHYHRRANDGYFSPILFQEYEGTVELYYAQSENIGYSLSGGFGIQKDELLPHFFYGEDLGFQAFFGIFTDWEARIRGGYTLRDNNTKNYNCWTVGAVLTRRFA